MDVLMRAAFYFVIAGLLFIAICWFVGSLRDFFSDDIVIAPMQITGQADADGKLAIAMAQILQAKLKHVEIELETSQRELMEESQPSSSTTGTRSVKHLYGIPPILGQQGVKIDARLLEPVNFNVTVGGVQVGGIFPWLQRQITYKKTLNFSVSYEGDSAIIAGNLAPLVESKDNSLYIRTEKATSDEIASSIAYAIIQKKLSEDPKNKLQVLDLKEFRTLLKILFESAVLNRRVALGRTAKDGFAALVDETEKLAIQVPDWYELRYLAANIAESADNYDKALVSYKMLDNLTESKNPQAEHITASVRKKVKDKILELQEKIIPKQLTIEKTAQTKIKADVEYAVQQLNHILQLNLEVPPVNILTDDIYNAYWDGKTLNYPPQIQYLPDIAYHEAAHPFIEKLAPSLVFQGESGSIIESYADVFASVIKQKREGRSAKDADWTLAPGAIAWLNNEDIQNSQNKSPLRSLKDPGTAYKDSIFGDDIQIADFTKIRDAKAPYDNGNLHINLGIPNKAFYETAIRIGTDKAIEIWRKALPLLDKDKHKDFISLANLTDKVAGEIYMENSEEQGAVIKAWETVKVPRGR